MKKLHFLLFSFLFAFSVVKADTFVAGKDYTVIDDKLPQQKKVVVLEFFNYGCPWCASIETAVEAWQKTLPTYVSFDRVPLTFEDGWKAYAKAYYFAKSQGIEGKITPKLFIAIHGKDNKEANDLSSPDALVNFFVANGVKKSVAEAAFIQGSPVLDAQVDYTQVQMDQYKVYAIPTFVIADKYKVDLSQGKKPERLMKIVSYLTDLAHSK